MASMVSTLTKRIKSLKKTCLLTLCAFLYRISILSKGCRRHKTGVSRGCVLQWNFSYETWEGILTGVASPKCVCYINVKLKHASYFRYPACIPILKLVWTVNSCTPLEPLTKTRFLQDSVKARHDSPTSSPSINTSENWANDTNIN